ncbi:MAG: carboxypeptidase regulatory-like domain-containing protein [Acidobacteriota bacterium]
MTRRRLAVAVGLAAIAIAVLMWRRSAGTNEPTAADDRALHRLASTGFNAMVGGTAAISGTVRDDRGAGIAGAHVCAEIQKRDAPRSRRRTPACTFSDEHGAYVIESLAPSLYSVAAAAPTFRPGFAKVAGDDGLNRLGTGERLAGVDLVLQRGAAEVTGNVMDAGGGPIAHALVRAAHDGDDGAALVETDEHGTFSLWTGPGEVSLDVSADGYTDSSAQTTAPGNVAVSLRPEATISGTVVDAATNQPLAGIAVDTATREWDTWMNPGAEVTDDQGRFRIDRLRPDRYSVLAHSDHGAGMSESSVIVSVGQHVDGVIVKMQPAYRVSGKVVVAGTPPAPCREPSLLLRVRVEDLPIGGTGDHDGSVHVGGLLPGTYEVDVSCADHVSPVEQPRIEVTDHDVDGLIWTVTTGATIRGRVRTRTGAPVGGARVETATDVASTTGDGSYQLRGVRAGDNTLFVTSDRGVSPLAGWRVSVPDSGVLERDLVLEEAGTLHGTVVDAAGMPVIDALVLGAPVIADAGREYPRARTARDGSFTIVNVREGEYRLQVFAARRGDEPMALSAGSLDDQGRLRVEVRASQTTTIRIAVEPHDGTIRGTVSDAAGPVPDVFVVAHRETGDGGAVEHTRYVPISDAVMTSPTGAFTIPLLAAGRYTLRAFRNGGTEAIAEHVAVGSTVAMKLPAAGSIEGTLHVKGGAPDVLIVGVNDARTGFDRTERFFRTGGHYVLRDLPPGAYSLRASFGNSGTGADVTLGEGEHAVVDLEAAGAAVSGRIVDVVARHPVAYLELTAIVSGMPLGQATTREDGSFRFDNVPAGAVAIRGIDGRYRFETLRRVGAVDTDLGDIGVAREPQSPGSRFGVPGITWVEYPDDMPSDQRAFQVAAIDPRGPAAATELRAGDIVASIDGIPVTGANRAAGWALMDAPPGTTIQFGLARGTTVAIVLAAP